MKEEHIPIQGETLSGFWRLLGGSFSSSDWQVAIQQAMHCLEGLPVAVDGTTTDEVMEAIQTERQFGSRHWQLNHLKRLYYQLVRPILPDFLKPFFRTRLLSRQRQGFALDWPVESRFVRFLFETVGHLLAVCELESMPHIHFWPDGKRFAFVLTHDVEAVVGQQFVRDVAALDEQYSFHSSFNFVLEEYRVDQKLVDELKARGFEVGVHGLKHDGKMYTSQAEFERQAQRINEYLKDWGAVGFRSPLTHRNPEWMQALEIEYDLSFFDTDPYEMMPGGTMSIWPFRMGHFIELPYTLPQDHTLMVTVGETTPRLWLEKVDFIEQCGGMALVNTHPDYLRDSRHLAIYAQFLQAMHEREGYWHALPRDVARWWRERAKLAVEPNGLGGWKPAACGFPASVGVIRRTPAGIMLE